LRPVPAQALAVSEWRVLSQRYALQLPFYALRVDRVQTAGGVILDDYPVVETRDWICVVCLDERGQAVMVEQYRHGVARRTLEFPAGRIDPGEDPLTAAKRELLEETGYASADFRLLRCVHPDSTRGRHRAHLFLALGASRVAEQHLDPGEEVVVSSRNLSDPELASELSHAVHVLALCLAREALRA
jgi:ADP-ribose pyrophosphatase